MGSSVNWYWNPLRLYLCRSGIKNSMKLLEIRYVLVCYLKVLCVTEILVKCMVMNSNQIFNHGHFCLLFPDSYTQMLLQTLLQMFCLHWDSWKEIWVHVSLIIIKITQLNSVRISRTNERIRFQQSKNNMELNELRMTVIFMTFC